MIFQHAQIYSSTRNSCKLRLPKRVVGSSECPNERIQRELCYDWGTCTWTLVCEIQRDTKIFNDYTHFLDYSFRALRYIETVVK